MSHASSGAPLAALNLLRRGGKASRVTRVQKIQKAVARCVSAELPRGSEQEADALWDVLADPGEWTPEMFGALEALAGLDGPRTETGVVKFTRPTVLLGDLVVDGDIECMTHTLVAGNVSCTGYLISGIHAGAMDDAGREALLKYILRPADCPRFDPATFIRVAIRGCASSTVELSREHEQSVLIDAARGSS